MAISEKQKLQKLTQIREVQAAIDHGVDISMLIDNLNRPPAERIRRHQNALNMAEKLRKAKFK
ncbi:hypothetical protein ACFL3G_13125 [Planctomycetota bacterium]